jgi:hypothetical protein
MSGEALRDERALFRVVRDEADACEESIAIE